MLVGMYYNNNDVRVEEMPIPTIGDDELLLKTDSCGICGTDVLEWYRIKTAPRVLGHEVTGTIIAIGKNVRDYKIGDRVFVAHHVPCNQCIYCLKGYHTACETLHKTNFYPGGFSQFIRIPSINIRYGTYILPPNLSFEEGIFIEPLGCVIRAQRLANIRQEDTVLIIGSGISGLLHVRFAKYNKVKKVIAVDINTYRLNSAKKSGADFMIDAKEELPLALKKINGRLADVVIICTGAIQAINQGFKSLDKGGRIVFFATPSPDIPVVIPINDFWRNEIKLLTSYGASTDDMNSALNLLLRNDFKVKDMITHRFGIAQIGDGFKITSDANESLKVIIKPNENV